MPIPVECPNGHRMTLPDRQAGRRYRCPLCLAYLDVPLPDPAALKAVKDSPEEQKLAARRQWGRYLLVRGLNYHYARLVFILLWLLGCMGFLIATAFLEEDLLKVPAEVVTGGILFIAPLLGLIGTVLCLWVPAE